MAERERAMTELSAAQPLLQKEASVCKTASDAKGQRVLGLVLVTCAALLFGVVAALIKAIHLPTLVLQQIRSIIEWLLGMATAVGYQRMESRRQGGVKTPLIELLFGPPELRKWIVVRALLYWLFLACWWAALNSMPMGDATAIVYVCPVFTATFSRLFLGEVVDWTFYPVAALAAVGVMLICQPSFIFGSVDASINGQNYSFGAASSLLAAIVGGLLPVCTRKSKSCVWTAINHCSSLLSTLVFTPIAILVWTRVDPGARDSLQDSVWKLTEPSDLQKWQLLLSATACGYVALGMQTVGYQMEQASRASIMTVLEIPFSYFLQFFIFNQPITRLGYAGAGLICCATLLNVLRRMQTTS